MELRGRLVGRGQVEAQAAGGSGDEEEEERVTRVEIVDQLLAVLPPRAAVQPHKAVRFYGTS